MTLGTSGCGRVHRAPGRCGVVTSGKVRAAGPAGWRCGHPGVGGVPAFGMMMGMLPPPRALLLDFGGVIADAPRRVTPPAELVERVRELTGGVLTAEEIAATLDSAADAHATWRDEVSSQQSPAELSHVQVWDNFVTRRWPAAAREAVRPHATPLSYAWTWRAEWRTRPGIPEVLRAAEATGLPVAVVSNTLCGAAHRDFLAHTDLAHLFRVQLYSDEIGVRKPNPEMAWRAARELDVPVSDCWFVGDSTARDIACARRAGAGAAVLMRSPRTARDPVVAGQEAPDATIEDGHGLLALLTGAGQDRPGAVGADVVEVRDDAGLAECVPVIREAFRTVMDDLGLTEADVPSNAAYLTVDQLLAARERGDRVLALRVGGLIVGSVSLRAGTRVGAFYLERLAVAPPYRHRGYGALLMERATELAATQGATEVSVGIIDANTALKRWYQRLGFVVTGTRHFDHLPFTVCYLHRPVTAFTA